MTQNHHIHAQHFLMCTMGGFLGAYALLLRGNFGSAETGNLLEVMIKIAEGDPLEIIIRLGGGLLFAIPFMLSRWMAVKTQINRQKLCLVLEATGLIVSAFLPATMHPVLALYPIFFISGFQWSVFSGTPEYPCATIFISNNTRQCVTALTDYLMNHQEAHLKRCLFYGGSILSFLTGGLISAFLSLSFGTMAALGGLIILLAAIFLTTI